MTLRRAGRAVGKYLLRGVTGLLLHTVDASLQRRGYVKTHRLLTATSPAVVPGRDAPQRARQVGITINGSARRRGWDRSCLRRSMVAWWVLRWLRIPAEIRIGITLQDDVPLAHAWLEHHGEPVNDALNIADYYPITYQGDLLNERGSLL